MNVSATLAAIDTVIDAAKRVQNGRQNLKDSKRFMEKHAQLKTHWKEIKTKGIDKKIKKRTKNANFTDPLTRAECRALNKFLQKMDQVI